MPDTTANATPLMGRILMSSVFLIFGVLKLTTFSYYAGMLAERGLPLATVAIAGAATLEILGGLAILVGFKTRIASWTLFAYLIPASIFFHNYWALQGALRAEMEAHFFKNMAIMGGLLFLAMWGPGPYSIDAARGTANS